MPSQTPIYQHYSDEVARLGTITIETGVDPGDPDYGPATLVDDNPAKVAKIDAVTGAWQIAYGAKQPAALLGLIHHDFDAGASVVIQGDDGPNWVAPAFSAAVTIPAWLGTGTRRWPVNPWLDLTEQAGYVAAGWQYYRLLVTGNSQFLQLGQLWLGATIRRLDPAMRFGFTEVVQKRGEVHRTSFGVTTRYRRLTNEWQLTASTRFGAALRAALEAHWFDVDGAGLPWLFVPDGLQNRCYLVLLEDRRAEQRPYPLIYEQPWMLQEVGRGLRPGT